MEMPKINPQYERAKVVGFFKLLEKVKNGRNIHSICGLQTALLHWEKILLVKIEAKKEHFTQREHELFSELKDRIKQVIRDERGLH